MMCAELVLPSDGLSTYLNVQKDARIVLCFSHCSSLSSLCLKYVGQNISLLRFMRGLPCHIKAGIQLERNWKFLAALSAAKGCVKQGSDQQQRVLGGGKVGCNRCTCRLRLCILHAVIRHFQRRGMSCPDLHEGQG